MHRESVYVCTYTAGEDEHVAHVRAWDGREAAELFACEIELDGGPDVHVDEIRVTPVHRRDAGVVSTAA
jgi:hypothetical protein